MKVLLLGFSRFVQRRVWPALRSLPEVSGVDLASRRAAEVEAAWRASGGGALFDDYAEALSRSDADWAYVSGANSGHAPWTEAALRSGRHTVVDKPATPSAAETRRLTDGARERGLCLAEALIYADHPLTETARAAFRERGEPARHLSAALSFPPLPDGDFRHDPALGGGAFLDLGIYAMSPGRIWFGAPPERIRCAVTSRHPATGVETGFSFLAVYSGGRTLTGHFGFDTVYRNRLTALGESFSAEADRVYTPPPDAPLPLRLWDGKRAETRELPAADSGARFIRRVRNAAASPEARAALADIMNQDARATDGLRRAAAEDRHADQSLELPG